MLVGTRSSGRTQLVRNGKGPGAWGSRGAAGFVPGPKAGGAPRSPARRASPRELEKVHQPLFPRRAERPVQEVGGPGGDPRSLLAAAGRLPGVPRAAPCWNHFIFFWLPDYPEGLSFPLVERKGWGRERVCPYGMGLVAGATGMFPGAQEKPQAVPSSVQVGSWYSLLCGAPCPGQASLVGFWSCDLRGDWSWGAHPLVGVQVPGRK